MNFQESIQNLNHMEPQMSLECWQEYNVTEKVLQRTDRATIQELNCLFNTKIALQKS
jgi:hypothetical protein